MSDRYLVPGLQDYATHMFEYLATHLCSTLPEWPDVVDLLFSVTREDDDIRDVASEISSEWCSMPVFRDTLRPIMRKHGDFASRVLDFTSPVARDPYSHASEPGRFRKRQKRYLVENVYSDGDDAFKRAHKRRLESLKKPTPIRAIEAKRVKKRARNAD